MKTKKKNRFLTFCFSLLPGAAEMYMGFMKTGISLMSLFLLMIIIAGWINVGPLAALGIVVWCYGFFHANHLAGLADEDFAQIKDEYLFGMNTFLEGKNFVNKYQKWIAAILIFVGISFLWDSAADMIYDMVPESYQVIARIMWRIGEYIPKLLAGLAIIAIGIKLICGKKAQLSEDVLMVEEKAEQEET